MLAHKTQRGGGAARFHPHHGTNIVFEHNRRTAIRSSSFANALTFSDKPLAPGEIFLVEIEETISGWSGHMRIGLTQMNPDTGFELPLYALPDLVSIGPCWLYAITKSNNTIYENRYDHQLVAEDELLEQDQIVPAPNAVAVARRRRARHEPENADDVGILDPANEPEDSSEDSDESVGGLFENNPHRVRVRGPTGPEAVVPGEASVQQNAQDNSRNLGRKKHQVLRREGDLTWTPCGYVSHKCLMPKLECGKEASSLLPTDVGSRIGVMFNPSGENTANMHFVINGEDQGPCSKDIPYENGPIYAVVDVYGSTTRIRAVQVYGVETLQSMCRDTILRSIQTAGVTSLPLPNPLKKYLLFN